MTTDTTGTMWFAASAFGIAPNNSTPWYKNTCVQDALLKGGATTALDAVGTFVPEGELLREQLPEGLAFGTEPQGFHKEGISSEGSNLLGELLTPP